MRGDLAQIDITALGHISAVRVHFHDAQKWKDNADRKAERPPVHTKVQLPKPSRSRAAVLNALRMHPDGRTAGEIERGFGINRASLDAMILKMLEEKVIEFGGYRQLPAGRKARVLVMK